MDQTAGDGAPDRPSDWLSPVVDVSGMSLDDLAAHAGDSALARCLHRLADQLAGPAEPIAGFNSAL